MNISQLGGFSVASAQCSCSPRGPGGPGGPGGQRPPEFQNLKEAIDSGDTNSIKAAIDSIKQKHSKMVASGQDTDSDSDSDPVATLLASLTKSLQSNDVSAMAKTFSSFEAEIKSHGPRHGGGAQTSQSGLQNDPMAALMKSTFSLFA